jgi:hypothetical protein
MTRTARRVPNLKKSGFHSGRLHARNIFAGTADVTLASGDGTATVTFAKPMPDAEYRVLLCPQEATTNDDLTFCVTTKTPQSFVIQVTSTNHATPITMGYLVLDSRSANSHRFGFKSGYANFRNFQFGKATVTLTDGAGTAKTITFPHKFKNKPLIFASFDDDTAVTAGFAYIATSGDQTNGQFILDCTGVTGPEGTVDITWVAFDPGFVFGTADKDGHKLASGHNTQAKFGIHSGNVRAKNIFGGLHKVTTDGNGDQTEAVTFGQMMKNTPVVFVFIQSPVNDTTGITYASSLSISGVTIGVNNSATTSDSLYIGYLAIDSEHRPTNTAES